MSITTHSLHTSLGSWTHSEWRPSRLAGIVEVMWHFDGVMALPRERTFPGGYLEIVLQLGPLFREVDDAGRTGGAFATAGITGVQLRPLVVEAPAARCCVLGVRLRPVGAYLVFAQPLHAMTGLSIDLAEVAGVEADELVERCREAATVEGRFALVAGWLERRLARAPAWDPAIAWASARLEATHGAEPVGAVRERAGHGATRFAELFRAQVGLTPKRYARLLRFRRALALLQAGRPLSDAALAAGYYDQSHMNADFAEFAAMTPLAFVRTTRYPNSPSVPEPA